MSHPIEVTADQLQKFLSDLSNSDQRITSSEVSNDYSPAMGDWTVSESLALSAIAKCRSATQILERLYHEGNPAGVVRVRHYVLEDFPKPPHLVSKTCFGHSADVAKQLENGELCKTIDPDSIEFSQPFWALLIRRPLVFLRSSGQRFMNSAQGVLTTVERCQDTLGAEKEPIWMDVPLFIGGRPYGKLSFDLSFLPDRGTASQEIMRLWACCQFAAPFLEVLSRGREPTQLGGHLFDESDCRHRNEGLFSKLLILEKAIAKLTNTWIYAKAERKGNIVFTYVSDSFANAIGEIPNDMLGHGDADFNDNEEEVREYAKIDREVLAGRKESAVIQNETWTDRRTNEIRHFCTTKEVIDIDGERHLVGIATDVTNQFVVDGQLAHLLANQSDVFGKILDAIDCCVVLKDLAGHTIYCNRLFASLVGKDSIDEVCQEKDGHYWDEDAMSAEKEEERFLIASKEMSAPITRTVCLQHSGEHVRLLIQRLPLVSSSATRSVLGVCNISVKIEEHSAREVAGVASKSVTTLEMSRKVLQAAIQPLCDLLNARRQN